MLFSRKEDLCRGRNDRAPWRWCDVALTDVAIERIKEMIRTGDLKPGDKLPREPDLAQSLGLSRNSLREAVKALSAINILTVRQGDGTYVTSLEPRLLLETLAFMVDFHVDNTVLDFLEVRRILEPAAAAKCAQLMPTEDVAALRELLDGLGAQPTVEDLVENDLEFHRRIAVGSGNAVLASLIESLSGPTARARMWRGMTQATAIERTLFEHRSILDAIDQRQPDVARSWATVHIAGVEQWLRNALTELP